jgi:hypothetical protein
MVASKQSKTSTVTITGASFFSFFFFFFFSSLSHSCASKTQNAHDLYALRENSFVVVLLLFCADQRTHASSHRFCFIFIP